MTNMVSIFVTGTIAIILLGCAYGSFPGPGVRKEGWVPLNFDMAPWWHHSFVGTRTDWKGNALPNGEFGIIPDTFFWKNSFRRRYFLIRLSRKTKGEYLPTIKQFGKILTFEAPVTTIDSKTLILQLKQDKKKLRFGGFHTLFVYKLGNMLWNDIDKANIQRLMLDFGGALLDYYDAGTFKHLSEFTAKTVQELALQMTLTEPNEIVDILYRTSQKIQRGDHVGMLIRELDPFFMTADRKRLIIKYLLKFRNFPKIPVSGYQLMHDFIQEMYLDTYEMATESYDSASLQKHIKMLNWYCRERYGDDYEPSRLPPMYRFADTAGKGGSSHV